MGGLVGTALVHGLIGLAVVVVLWPTTSAGRRFLLRWGVPEPDDRQSAQAVRYLRDRRLLYPVLFLLTPVVAGPAARAFGFADQSSGAVRNFAPLLVALLVAEAAAALRPVRGTRTATLARRHWRDLVPRWAIGLLLVLGAVAALLAGAGLAAQPWADRVAATFPADGVWRSADGTAEGTVSVQYLAEMREPVSLVALIGVACGLVVVLGVVRLAVRRRSLAEPPVDAAFRTRSARVAVGIGLAWTAAVVLVAGNRLDFLRGLDFTAAGAEPVPAWLEHTSTGGYLGLVTLLVGVGGWIWVANPSRPPASRTAA
ncbi:hypothetical protein B0I31_101525 [Saccharothrix carnea]|uniref:Uncharacterized protein n=1 Tax=Saccharothrix carnea TaxID=1280637 RepID=A0A2P8IIN3_SACCR|nr:hypothetical protein [Saccharothrix carnea]PSL58307.1 hypothetical protein B0I31_101525 [Saccharothrix carnea]